MGYRPYIYIKAKGFDSGIELGKFYGYITDAENLKSVKYLIFHKFIKNACEFEGGMGPEIELDAHQFRKWFNLYCHELGTYDWRKIDNYIHYPKDFDAFKAWPKLREIYDSVGDKVISWG